MENIKDARQNLLPYIDTEVVLQVDTEKRIDLALCLIWTLNILKYLFLV